MDGAATDEPHERFIDGAVIAAIENENLRSAGHGASHTQRKPVRVGGGRGDLPVRQPEALCQQAAYGHGVRRGQHVRQALAGLAHDRLDDGRRANARTSSRYRRGRNPRIRDRRCRATWSRARTRRRTGMASTSPASSAWARRRSSRGCLVRSGQRNGDGPPHILPARRRAPTRCVSRKTPPIVAVSKVPLVFAGNGIVVPWHCRTALREAAAQVDAPGVLMDTAPRDERNRDKQSEHQLVVAPLIKEWGRTR